MSVIIFGAGIAGLSTGYHLKKNGFEVTLYEKDDEVGGLCRSKTYNNLIFDYGVHVSFTSDEYVKNIFTRSVNNNYEEQQVSCMNHWKGYWIKHEPQDNLHNLPKEVIRDCLIDLIHARYENRKDIKNFRDWCYKKYGRYFTENFSKKYNKKFWTIDIQKLTTDWIGSRFHQSDLQTVISGALNIPIDNKHYVTTFRYPKEGGYASYLKLMKTDLDIELKTYPIEIDLERKEVLLNNNEIKPYKKLISTIPLPELIKCIKNVPEDVRNAANKLNWTSLLMLNFYIKRKLEKPSQWNYYYDEEIPYSRIFYMSKFARNNAPANYETFQAEIPYSKEKPLNSEIEKLIENVIQYIHKTENISIDEICYLDNINIKYGYVIYDMNRKKNLEQIHRFLDDNNIHYCGRWGEWAYLWSDQAFLSGKRTAELIKNEERLS